MKNLIEHLMQHGAEVTVDSGLWDPTNKHSPNWSWASVTIDNKYIGRGDSSTPSESIDLAFQDLILTILDDALDIEQE